MDQLLIIVIIFFSALLQGLSGFGSALIAMSLLPLFVDIHFAVPLIALNAIVLNILNFYKVKDQFRFKELTPIIIGSAFGVPLGIYCLKNVDPTIIKPVIGILLLSYSVYSILFKPHHIKKAKNLLGLIFGFLAGIMGGAFTMNGPFIVIYCSMRYRDKHIIKAMMSSYFTIVGLYICSLLAMKGFITKDVLINFAASIPFLIAGIFLGQHFYNKIDHEVFKKIIYIVLAVTGSLLIIK